MTSETARNLATRLGWHIHLETLEDGLQRQTVRWPSGAVTRHDERWPRLPCAPRGDGER